ncbi:MAG: hypothetical protein ACT4P1_10670 [Sporichthyaceae bacterium]
MNRDAHPDRKPADRPKRLPCPTPAEPVPTVDVHDPRLTAVLLARQLDELARALNYATRAAGPRLEYASDVYEVLRSLRAALTKLPQACGQLADFLRRQDAAGTLRAERGFPHARRPDVAVANAAFNLGQAAVAANVTATALGRAQETISGLSHNELENSRPARARASRLLGITEPEAAPTQGPGVEP